MPSFSRKYDLSQDGVAQADGDDLVVPFLLDQNFSLGGLVPGMEIICEARFDPDGIVDTREPNMVIEQVATKPNDDAIEIVLKGN